MGCTVSSGSPLRSPSTVAVRSSPVNVAPVAGASQADLRLQGLMTAVAEARTGGDAAAECRALGKLANEYKRRGEFGRMLELHTRRLRLAEERGCTDEQGLACGGIGNAHMALGDVAQALEYHKRHLSVALRCRNVSSEAKARQNLGNAYQCSGDYARAVEMHQRRLDIAVAENDKEGESASCANLGNAYRPLGELERALECHARDLSLSEASGDQSGVARACNNLGLAHEELHDYARAYGLYARSLAISAELGDREAVALAHGNIGSLLERRRDFAKALEFHKKRLAYAVEARQRLGEASALLGVGACHRRTGDVARALECHRRALSLAEAAQSRPDALWAHEALGRDLLAGGDASAAAEAFEKALVVARDTNERHAVGALLCRLGLARTDAGDAVRGRELLREAVRWDEDLRAGPGASPAVDALQRKAAAALVDALAAQGSASEALEHSDCAKTLGGLRAMLPEASRRRAAAAELCAVAASRGASLLAYHVCPKRGLWAWLVPRGAQPEAVVAERLLSFRGPEGRRASERLAQLVRECRLRGPGAAETLRGLSEALLGSGDLARALPALARTCGSRRLVVVPHRLLWGAPFAALEAPAGAPLCQSLAVTCAPSIAVFDALCARAEALPRQRALVAAVVADPSPAPASPESLAPLEGTGADPPALPGLPDARDEAARVARALRASAEPRELVGAQATRPKAAEAMRGAAVVHVATHIDCTASAGPRAGALALARAPGDCDGDGDDDDDGWLRTSEVAALPLASAPVVVVSARAAGDAWGDAVAGVAGAFAVAGAACVVVAGLASSAVVEEFYAGLLRGQAPADAFEGAREAAERRGEAAASWACPAFVGGFARERLSR
eukprot:m51a1_g6557 hypothetical protein (859) ;mRNA; r:108887-111693